MSRCPICESSKIVIVIGPVRSAFCDLCGARWIQEGSHQRRIKRAPLSLLVDESV